ncbi:MAG: hypothetical protein ACPGXK_13310 [Phycisphaerae bacterium]
MMQSTINPIVGLAPSCVCAVILFVATASHVTLAQQSTSSKEIKPITAASPQDPEQRLLEALDLFDQAQEVEPKQRDQAKKLFLKAASMMKTLIREGTRNGKLEYNIGNCYLKAGKLGEAILHYRRAEQFIPNDPLLQDNLREARKRCLTNINARGSQTLLRSVFFLHFSTSLAGRTTLLIVTYVLFWLLLGIRCFVASRPLSVAAMVCLFVSVTVGMSVAIERWQQKNRPEGVVLAIDVAAFNGPGESYKRRFEQPLQPGVEFVLRTRRGDWWQIELPDGNLGWIEAGQARLIPL